MGGGGGGLGDMAYLRKLMTGQTAVQSGFMQTNWRAAGHQSGVCFVPINWHDTQPNGVLIPALVRFYPCWSPTASLPGEWVTHICHSSTRHPLCHTHTEYELCTYVQRHIGLPLYIYTQVYKDWWPFSKSEGPKRYMSVSAIYQNTHLSNSKIIRRIRYYYLFHCYCPIFIQHCSKPWI